MKKQSIACIALSALMLGTTGCGIMPGGGGGENYDPNKTHINIAYFNGGVVVDWLKALETEYEALNPDIDIHIDTKYKEELKNQKLFTLIDGMNHDIFFTHVIDVENFSLSGKVADLSDIYNNPATTGEKNVVDKMNPEFVNHYKQKDNKFYAIPFYDNFFGAVYDVDLFEEKGFFIGQDGEYTNGIDTPKSLGKDGVPETYDDGLPATFDEFKDLLAYMKYENSVMPFIWNTDDAYRMDYLKSVWAGYEGKNDFSINYTFDGTDSQFGKITNENATLLLDQYGKKYAIELCEEIIDGAYYDDRSMLTSTTHLVAQKFFLDSWPKLNQPIAMILEGGWWEHEASTRFGSGQWAMGERRFAYMPVPKYDADGDGVAEGNPGETFYSTSGSTTAIVKAKSPYVEEAKEFLKFTLTDHAMSVFTQYTGVVRPFDYDLEEGVYENELTPFGQSLWDTYRNPQTSVVYTFAQNEFKKSEAAYFSPWLFGTSGATDPFIAFYDNTNLTTSQYLAGAKSRYSDYQTRLSNWKASK